MAWEKLGTTSVGGAAVANTSWKELGRTTLGSNGDSIDVTSLATKDNLMVLCHTFNTGGASGAMANQFNGDTGANYSERRSTNGGSDGTTTGATGYNATSGEWNSSTFHVSNIINIAAQEKLITTSSAMVETAGNSNEPRRQEAVAKWANTSAQINRINIKNSGAGDFASGSEVVVLGYDNDEADSGTNFWQELASVELSSSANTISSGTFTAKKYLKVVFYGNDVASGSATPRIRFNSDSGSNYADRTSNNGASDSTSTSQSFAFISESDIDNGTLITFDIINKSDKEKLFVGSGTRISSTGASNVPSRFEFSGKWANTSAQITSIDVLAHHSVSSYKFNTGTYMKVYGAD